MRITLVESEIAEILGNHFGDSLDVSQDKRLDVDLKPTRGEKGVTAIIDIVDASSPKPEYQGQSLEEGQNDNGAAPVTAVNQAATTTPRPTVTPGVLADGSEPVKRRPGRPSNAELAARAEAARLAEQGNTAPPAGQVASSNSETPAEDVREEAVIGHNDGALSQEDQEAIDALDQPAPRQDDDGADEPVEPANQPVNQVQQVDNVNAEPPVPTTSVQAPAQRPGSLFASLRRPTNG